MARRSGLRPLSVLLGLFCVFPVDLPGCFSQIHVLVSDLEGRSFPGDLVSLENGKIFLRSDSETRELSFEKILDMKIRGDSEKGKDSPRIEQGWVLLELIDGSRVIAKEFSLTGNKVRLAPDREILLEQVSFVRFSPTIEEIEGESARNFRDIVQSPSPEDRIVVGTPDSLDFYSGIVHGIDTEAVRFELDGEILPLGLKKLIGVVFRTSNSPIQGSPLCTLLENDGSFWVLSEVQFPKSAETFRWKSLCGIEGTTKTGDLIAISFARRNIQSLLEMVPSSIRFTPTVRWGDSQSREPLELLQKFSRSSVLNTRDLHEETEVSRPNSPLKNAFHNLSDIQLDGKIYSRGFTLNAGTELNYRLEGEFQTLRGIAGIDDRLRPHGNVKLTIRGDDRVLFSEPIRGEEPAKTLHIGTSGIKHLSIEVEMSRGIHAGSRLNLVEMQLVTQ